MNKSTFYIIMTILFMLGVSVIVTNMTISKQKQHIEQLTERVQLLETALSNKSGIKK